METEEFEKLVSEAIEGLPQNIRDKMDNVAVVVEGLPTADQLKKGGTRKSDILLGLYEGVPRTSRGAGYNLVLPDKITIFKNSIEAITSSPEEIKKQVSETVWHEIAHHFGFSEDGVRNLSQKRKA